MGTTGEEGALDLLPGIQSTKQASDSKRNSQAYSKPRESKGTQEITTAPNKENVLLRTSLAPHTGR